MINNYNHSGGAMIGIPQFLLGLPHTTTWRQMGSLQKKHHCTKHIIVFTSSTTFSANAAYHEKLTRKYVWINCSNPCLDNTVVCGVCLTKTNCQRRVAEVKSQTKSSYKSSKQKACPRSPKTNANPNQ